MEVKKRYNMICEIGEGSFGIVHKAMDRATGQIVAIKELKPPCSPSLYLPEITALTNLAHPRIVNLKQVIHTGDDRDERVFLVFEYMNCCLRGFMNHRRLRPFSEDEIRSMAFQVLQGLDFMHRRKGYMHRDLKPENMLVNERGEVKISDLGGAVEIDPMGNEFVKHVTTLHYEAPEMIVETIYDEKVDMWAMGLILVEMYTMYPICKGRNSVEQLYMIRHVIGEPDCDSGIGRLVNARLVGMPALERKGGVGFEYIVPDASDLAIDLMEKLCCWEPYKRLSAAEAMRHPFFKALNNAAAAPPGFSSCYVVPKATNLSYMQPIC